MFLAGIVTFLIRFSFIGLWGKLHLPEFVNKSLSYIPTAVLSAIVVPELLIREGQVDVSLMNSRLLAGVIAILVAWKTKSPILTILAGMGALLLLQFLLR